MKKQFVALVLLSILFSATGALAQTDLPPEEANLAPLGSGFIYQGYLTNNAGEPLSATCDFTFSLWNDDDAGTKVGTNSTSLGVAVVNGYFNAKVNAGGEFGTNAYIANARWLGVGVRCPAGSGTYTNLTPRQALSPTPFAQFSQKAGSVPWGGLSGVPLGFADEVDNNTLYTAGTGLSLAGGAFSVNFAGSGSAVTAAHSDHGHSNFWRLGGNNGTTDGTHFIGTTDNVPLTIRVNNQQALRIEPFPLSPNIIGGYSGNIVSNGAFGATIGGGGQVSEINQVDAMFGTIGGGSRNYIAGVNSTIAGGYFNYASGPYATVGGGFSAYVTGDYATVAGGISNDATEMYATVGGGRDNHAIGQNTTIPGGNGATASQYGQMAYASGYFADFGDAQTSIYIVRGETSDGAYHTLSLDQLGDRLNISEGQTLVFDIQVVGRSTGGESAGYEMKGVIENVGGVTSFVGWTPVTVLGEDDAAWDSTISINLDMLDVWVKGNNEPSILWVATIRTTEVSVP